MKSIMCFQRCVGAVNMGKKKEKVYKKVNGKYVIDIDRLVSQITHRKDGLLQFRYYDALNTRKYIYGHSIEEIADQYDTILNLKGSMCLAYNSTVDEAFVVLLNRVKKNNIKAVTYAKNVVNWSLHVSKYIGNTRIVDLTFDTIQALFDEYYNQKMSYEMRLKLFNSLSAALEYACTAGVIKSNPSLGISIQENVDNLRTSEGLTILTQEQITELIEITKGTSIELIIVIALYTGMRCGEIIALRKSSIDLENNVIHVTATLTSYYYYNGTDANEVLYCSPKTKNSVRDIPIHKNLRPYLINLKTHRFRVLAGDTITKLHFVEINDFIITTQSNKLFSVSGVDSILYRRYVSRYRELARMDCLMGRPVTEFHYFSMHDLRATVATRLFKNKTDLLDVRDLLGHANASTTLKYYLKSTEEGRKNIIDKLNILNDD